MKEVIIKQNLLKIFLNVCEKSFLFKMFKVHYAHPLPDADNTGLSLIYQTSPAKYQAGILLLGSGAVRLSRLYILVKQISSSSKK